MSGQSEDGASYAQPTPRRLYVHDDLTDEVCRRLGADSPAVALVARLFALLRADEPRVIVLSLEEQLARVVAHGPYAPFDLTLGLARAGERVANQLHGRAGWFPRIRRIDVTREEDGRGGYTVVGTDGASLSEQLAAVGAWRSLAVVDDTVFSGITMRAVIGGLSSELRARARAFCLRGIADSLAAIGNLCPIVAGVSAPGRLLSDVSFINATGLVLRVAIRRRGHPPLAFFDRPDWIRAWFPGYDRDVLELCRRVNGLLEPSVPPGENSSRGNSESRSTIPSSS